MSGQKGPETDQRLFYGKNIYTLELAAPELLEFAVYMERVGAEYYRALADLVEGAKPREFFLQLTGAELGHEKDMRKLHRIAAEREVEYMGLEEGITGRDFLVRFREIARQKVFVAGLDLTPSLPGPQGMVEAVSAAVQAERHSVYLYNYLSRFKLYGDAKKVAEKLKDEEERHLAGLTVLLKKARAGTLAI